MIHVPWNLWPENRRCTVSDGKKDKLNCGNADETKPPTTNVRTEEWLAS